MKKITVVLLVLFLGQACETDNYDAPDMTLEGKVVDRTTGENIQTRQPNGIKIRLVEEGYQNPQPYDFWAKPDGTFKNTKLFPAKYSVTVLEGAFEDASVTPVAVDLRQDQSITFEVEPFVRLTNVHISASGGTITATYKIERTTSTRALVRSMLLCHESVILHESTIGVKKSTENNLSAMDDSQITSTAFTDQISGLTSGTYYARVAVLAANSLNRYNYSPIVKLVVE